MSILVILGFLFIAEVAIIAIGFVIYFYRQLKKLKESLADHEGEKDDKNIYDNLKDIFDQQIKLTLQQIAKYSGGEENASHRKISQLLSKRVEYLKLEKEVSDEEVKDKNYWKKLCDQIAGIIVVKKQEVSEPEKEQKISSASSNEKEIPDDAVYRKKILRYQAQIMALHQEFEDYRKYNKRLVSQVSDYDKGEDADAALNELMADIKDHDDRLQASLSKIQNENDHLQKQLNDSEKETYKLDYELQRKKQSPTTANDISVTTAAEEEISRLRDIIDRQYGSLDELKQAMAGGEDNSENSAIITQKLEAVERSQTELQTCVEVLEMDNLRLTQALEEATQAAEKVSEANTGAEESPDAKEKLAELYELRLKSKEQIDAIGELSTQLEAKETELATLNEDFSSLQGEFMQIYEKQDK